MFCAMREEQLGGALGFSSNLDLDELLSYFLSGSFFLSALAIGQPEVTGQALVLLGSLGDTTLLKTVQFIVLFSLSLMMGHGFSILVRTLGRPLINWLLGDPRRAVLPSYKKNKRSMESGGFFTNEFRDAIAEKYQKVFKEDISSMPEKNVPRVVRSYVFHNSESARGARERILRGRSFCGNMSLSCFAGSIINLASFSIAAHLALWVLGFLLVAKQRSLDLREAKEIYTHFLVV